MDTKSTRQASPSEPGLHRALGLWTLTAFGVGDILGAGIYALIGQVAGKAGGFAWASFLIILGIALLTALSYAELGSRFPRSGGESYFCQRALGRPSMALLIGLLVCLSGLFSLATVSRAFGGYFAEVVGWEFGTTHWSAFAFLAVLAGIAFRGIRQSSAVNVFCTIVEVGGLLFVIGAGVLFLRQHGNEVIAASPDWTWVGILQGGALAFFAFIGFEDMVNVAEEVEQPHRNLPRGILMALSIAASIYLLVAWVATSVVPIEVLASSQAPLLEVVRRAAPRVPDWSFTCVALFAVANTGLLNLVMGSRLLYGMAGQGLLPGSLHTVHRKTHTPHRTIWLMFVAALVLALSGTLPYLAGTTNVLLLLVFSSVNLSLIVLRVREPEPMPGFRVPLIIPAIGATSCLAMIAFVPRTSLVTASILISIAVIIVAVWSWRKRR